MFYKTVIIHKVKLVSIPTNTINPSCTNTSYRVFYIFQDISGPHMYTRPHLYTKPHSYGNIQAQEFKPRSFIPTVFHKKIITPRKEPTLHHIWI